MLIIYTYYVLRASLLHERTNQSIPIKETTTMELSKLESMPTELHIAILEQAPDINSLSALVLASPVIHKAYTIARLSILTKVTLRETMKWLSLMSLENNRLRQEQQWKFQGGDHVARQTCPISQIARRRTDISTL